MKTCNQQRTKPAKHSQSWSGEIVTGLWLLLYSVVLRYLMHLPLNLH